jgi:hypothetical protein
MHVIIHNLYTGTKKTVEGTPSEVEFELLRNYPFLNSEYPDHHGDVEALVEHLNVQQALEAEIIDRDEKPLLKSEGRNLPGDEDEVVASMLGYDHKLFTALEAVRFLAGGKPVSFEKVRQARWQADGDPEETALVAYGLEPSAANLAALRGIQGLSKAEQEPVKADTVEPGHPDADETAQEVDEAFRDHFVVPVKLGGKHSKGSLLARDQSSGNTWLLKPGSGGQTPAAGAKQDPSSQSRREAAFYHMADAWHLGDFFPRADLLVIDGKEYAALHLLPWAYRGMDKLKAQDVQAARTILADYLKRGILHRWAVLDFVLGNPDRHAGNLMVHDGDVKLIDHGSAFAGTQFDPAHDKYSFTPYYLRAWSDGKFSEMEPGAKFKAMPRVDHQTEESLRKWIEGLDAKDLDRVLLRYGVESAPAKTRLAQVKALIANKPADEAINRLWIET